MNWLDLSLLACVMAYLYGWTKVHDKETRLLHQKLDVLLAEIEEAKSEAKKNKDS